MANDWTPEDYPLTAAWNAYRQQFAAGGDVTQQKKATAEKAHGGRAFGLHPLHKIPGVHIITAEAGEPVFTGEK